jgi:hypothetical protein
VAHPREKPDHPLGVLRSIAPTQVLGDLAVQETILTVERPRRLHRFLRREAIAGALEDPGADKVKVWQARGVGEAGVDGGESAGRVVEAVVVLSEEVEGPDVGRRRVGRGVVGVADGLGGVLQAASPLEGIPVAFDKGQDRIPLGGVAVQGADVDVERREALDEGVGEVDVGALAEGIALSDLQRDLADGERLWLSHADLVQLGEAVGSIVILQRDYAERHATGRISRVSMLTQIIAASTKIAADVLIVVRIRFEQGVPREAGRRIIAGLLLHTRPAAFKSISIDDPGSVLGEEGETDAGFAGFFEDEGVVKVDLGHFKVVLGHVARFQSFKASEDLVSLVEAAGEMVGDGETEPVDAHPWLQADHGDAMLEGLVKESEVVLEVNEVAEDIVLVLRARDLSQSRTSSRHSELAFSILMA